MSTLDTAALRLAALVECSDDAIISHGLDGTIETWNRAAERMYGYRASDVIGLPVEIIVPFDRRSEEQAFIHRMRHGETISHFETVGVTRDGRRIPVSLSVSPVLTPDGELIGVARITRDISNQRMLERDAQRLAAIVDSSDDAIVSKNLKGIVQTWNEAAERMFGYAAEEMIGQSVLKIIPTDRWPEEDRVLSQIVAGRRIEHFETIRRRKDGSLIEISLTVSPIKLPSGEIVGASKIARDITLQRQLAREAETANRVKDDFLATLSHELRTPLNAVLGYTHMLRTGQIGEGGQERAIAIIERNATMLSQLVSDVLDVSSIVTGKIRLSLAVRDIGSIVRSGIDAVRPAADAKALTVRFDGPADPVCVRCDGDRLQQVFWNLLFNAVKFTPAAGDVSVRLWQNDGTAHVSIADSGIGIPAASLPYVFERFWQGERTRERQTHGLGLGLALARHFVELHGGTVAVQSEGEGKGATFSVALPVAPGECAGS